MAKWLKPLNSVAHRVPWNLIAILMKGRPVQLY